MPGGDEICDSLFSYTDLEKRPNHHRGTRGALKFGIFQHPVSARISRVSGLEAVLPVGITQRLIRHSMHRRYPYRFSLGCGIVAAGCEHSPRPAVETLGGFAQPWWRRPRFRPVIVRFAARKRNSPSGPGFLSIPRAQLVGI
jgi:hypothetical protein